LASLVDLKSGHESLGASTGSRSVQQCPSAFGELALVA